jgi:DNA-binding response OmpR family regulator
MFQRQPRIAVVDDDRAYIDMMEDILSDEGFETVTYRSAAEARRRLPHDTPDLIIVDLWVEHVAAGSALVEWLRLEPATRCTPLLICSGDTRQLELFAPARHGVATLRKPFELDEMLATVRGMLPASHSSPAQPSA